jgi:hypothetical protein
LLVVTGQSPRSSLRPPGCNSGGGTKPISAVWKSSSPSIATVNSSGLAKATGTSAGTLTITASSGSVSGYATLSVAYNEDLGSGGGGGDECYDGGDCSENECCYNSQCSPCQEQGYFRTLLRDPVVHFPKHATETETGDQNEKK